MPTYDYICKDCEKMYEYFQSMSDTPIKKCPECNKNSLRYKHQAYLYQKYHFLDH